MEKRASDMIVVDIEYDRPVRMFLPGRQCAQPLCGTLLSIYNSGSYSALHPTGSNQKQKRRRVRERRFDNMERLPT